MENIQISPKKFNIIHKCSQSFKNDQKLQVCKNRYHPIQESFGHLVHFLCVKVGGSRFVNVQDFSIRKSGGRNHLSVNAH